MNNQLPNNPFYGQYQQQQAQTSQWLRQLQQIIDPNNAARNSTRGRPCHNVTQCHNCPAARGHPFGAQACNIRHPIHNRPQPNSFGCHARPVFSAPNPCCQRFAGTSSRYHPCCTGQSRPCNAQMPVPPYGEPYPGYVVPASREVGTYPNIPQRDEQDYDEEDYGEEDGEMEEQESYAESEEESGSDDGLVCDVDAIIAMRATRDESDKVSEESFELVDSVENERMQFDYIEMDEFGIMQRRSGKPTQVNTLEDEMRKKEERRVLYGDRADAMGGLETLMAINFDHFLDTHRPVLWPVLPL